MQWLEFIYKFFSKIKFNCFTKKYKIKDVNFLKSLYENEKKMSKWQIVDTRNNFSYIDDGHLPNTTNITPISSSYSIYKNINKSKKILIINENYRSHLQLYKLLKSKGLNVYIFYGKIKEDIVKNPIFKKYVIHPNF